MAVYLIHFEECFHHAKHYGGAVKALKAIEDKAYGPEGVADAATRRELGKAQSEKANSVILHELYFRGMAAKAPDPSENVRGSPPTTVDTIAWPRAA